MKVYFIRHAQSLNNAIWENTGSSKGRNEDPELSEKGVQQLTYLSNYFIEKQTQPNGHENFSFTHLYSSPMVRAIRTGLSVSSIFDLKIKLMVDLHEGGGIFLEDETGKLNGLPGKPRSYFLQQFPEVIPDEAMEETGWWNRPFEPFDQRLFRAQRVWKYLVTTHQDEDCIGLFSHAGFFNYFLSHITQRTLSEEIWFELNNASITQIDYDKAHDKINIRYVNKNHFLPVELIT